MHNKKIIHIVPHSHWDREWYMSFEKHRFRLIKLMDSLIEKMESDPDYKYFHLDGQMIALEDYLKIKPYMAERLKKLINEGRIQVGPWYILQDEYLTSDEANVRNMLLGLELGEEMGVQTVKIGYLPDSFGNISQMPQILKKCGIEAVVFGRGVENISEIIWEAPDGSQVLGAHFTSWYSNANELPLEPSAAAERAAAMLAKFYSASVNNDYLGMNGSDHQPIQLNLPQAIEAMNNATEENIRFVHSNLPDYIAAISGNRGNYPLIKEEMAGQHTSGNGLLISTASSRIYMKQKNWAAQNALERIAEPLSAISYINGGEYNSDFFKYAWKKLLENHAHDSICGCSVDEVHRENITRFEKVLQLADSITEDALAGLECHLNVNYELGYPVAVFNNSLYKRSDIVTVTVDVPEDKGVLELSLVDSMGNTVSDEVTVYPHTFTYKLPSNSFRVVEYVNRYIFKFTAKDVPAFGYSVYYAVEGKSSEKLMNHTANSAENEYLKLVIESDGSLTVTDKETGREFKGLNIYEDTADIGDEYLFKANGTAAPVTTEGGKATVTLKSVASGFVTFRVEQEMLLPESYNRKLNSFSEKKAPLIITSDITLTSFSRKIGVKTYIENNCECHRLRALFKNSIETDKVLVNGQFDIVERNIATDKVWKWPTNEQRLQSFVALKDSKDMLLVATKALYEYEVMRDGSNTLGIVLLRSVDQLGDWGDFPTPDAQCKGNNIAEYEIYVGSAEVFEELQTEAFQFASGKMPTYQIKSNTACGNAANELISAEGLGVWNTAFKKQQNGEALVLRLYNTRSTANNVKLKLADCFASVTETDMLEKAEGNTYSNNGEGISLEFGAKEIKTLLLKKR